MRTALFVCSVLGLAGPSLAQESATPTELQVQPKSARQTSEQETAPLAGRTVATEALHPTLVERDFEGKLRRPEPTAIEAAVGKLGLTGEQRERVDNVLTQRARAMESFVAENLDLIMRLGTLEHSTDTRDKVLTAVEAFQKLAPLRKEGPLDAQVRSALSAEKAAEFDRLLREYWNALAEEDRHESKPKGRVGIIADAKLKDLGKELEAAFHRSERSGGVLYGYLFKGMSLSDEQGKRLRELCAVYSASGLDDKDKGTQGTFFLAVMQQLEPEQQKVFVKRLRGK